MAACYHAKTVAAGLKSADMFNEAGIGITGAAKIMAIYGRYRGWLEAYKGGIPALSLAEGINHESGGNPLSTSDDDPDLRETGLITVTTGVSKRLDIDPFDPESNIWAGARLRNERFLSILADPKYSWLKDASRWDFTSLVVKGTGVGFPGWKKFMDIVFPVPPAKGSFARLHPQLYVNQWLRDNPGKVPTLGRQGPGVVACRFARNSSADWLKEMGSLAKPRGFKLIPRPKHLPHFDEAKYNKMWSLSEAARMAQYPEYLTRFPPPWSPSKAVAGKVVVALLVLGALGGAGYVGWLYREPIKDWFHTLFVRALPSRT